VMALRRLLSAVTLALMTTVGMSAPAEARIKRSQSAKVEFKQQHPCPGTGARKGPCKGYVIAPVHGPRHAPARERDCHRMAGAAHRGGNPRAREHAMKSTS
jgi:hypothetical protein